MSRPGHRCICAYPVVPYKLPNGEDTLSGHAPVCPVEEEYRQMARAHAERERRHEELMIANEVVRKPRKWTIRALKR